MSETIKPENEGQDRESAAIHQDEGGVVVSETTHQADHEGTGLSDANHAEPEADSPEQAMEQDPSVPTAEEDPEGFAASVVSGLEQLDIEEHDLLELTEVVSGETPASEGRYFTGWDGLDVPSAAPAEPYQTGLQDEYDPALGTLSELGLASAKILSGFAAAAAPETGKHDELADAVQAALRSVYGGSARQNEPAYQGLSFREETLGWQAPAPSAPEELSPQDVILNYFDYNPTRQGHERTQDGSGPQDAQDWLRSLPGAVPQQSGRTFEARVPPVASAPAPSPVPEPAPVFSLPVAPVQASRALGSPEQESSRLLGAAAIGLIGGIAIAASLAAFLIYGGPHQASFEIPGLGNFRLDKDDQGYGRAALEEGVSEAPKSVLTKPAPEFTSEVLAADAVTMPGQPVPLAVSVRSQQPFERTLVSISGIPEGGRLNTGIDAGGGNWLLPPRRLNGLTLSLPAGVPDTIPLEVQLLDSNVRTPLSAKSQFVVRVRPSAAPAAIVQNTVPASPLPVTDTKPNPPPAPPVFALDAQASTLPGQPSAASLAAAPAPAPETSFRTQTIAAASPPPFQASLAPTSPTPPGPRRTAPRPEVEDLIREGNKRMREGDILEARQFYQRAVAYGDPEAALAMGRSFDPIYFARIDKKNAEPDAAKAFDWYRRAMDAGAAQTALVRIENLKHFLNE